MLPHKVMLYLRFFVLLSITSVLLAYASFNTIHAQNVGGVFGPEVTPGSRAAEFRTAFAPPSNGRPDRITSRFHFQQSVTDALRLRAVIQGADTNVSGFDFDLVQLEAQYQIFEDETSGFDGAIRVDLLLGEDRPNLVSVNWTSDLPLNSKWYLRTVALAQVQFGDLRNDGLFLQTRGALAYRLNPAVQLQAQVFNFYGSTADFQDFDQQNHAIGPAISAKLGHGWSLEASTLFGVTNAAANTDFRIFLAKSF